MLVEGVVQVQCGQYLVPRSVKRLRTPMCSVPSVPTVTSTLDRVACPQAGQNTLLWFLQMVAHPSQRNTERCRDVISFPPFETNRSPICIATFCSSITVSEKLGYKRPFMGMPVLDDIWVHHTTNALVFRLHNEVPASDNPVMSWC